MLKLEKREYQERAVADCINYLRSDYNKPVVAVLPTAAGKSLIIARVAKAVEGKAIILQPSIELLNQNVGKAKALGAESIAIYSAGANSKVMDVLTYCTLGSIKTLAKEFKKLGVTTVIIDECHTGVAPEKTSMFRKFIDELKPKKVIGFTATPYRLRSSMQGTKLKMLHNLYPSYFKKIIHVTQIQELVEGGYWSPIEYKAYEFDSKRLTLNSTGADFTDDSIKRVMSELGVNNTIYKEVISLYNRGIRRGLVFTDSVETAKILHKFLKEKTQIKTAYLDANTKKSERKKIIEDFTSGKIHFLFNFGVLVVGFDYPELEVVLVGRPTNSLAIWYQEVGRGVRIHPDKPKVEVIDFCGNLERFGRVEEQEIINFATYGWGVFAGEKLITNVILSNGYTMTKERLLAPKDIKESLAYVMTFGKHKGETLAYIDKNDPGYIPFLLKDFQGNTKWILDLKAHMTNIIDQQVISSI